MNKKKAIELAKFKKKNGIGRVGCQMSNGRDQLKITREKTEKILKKMKLIHPKGCIFQELF